MATAEQVNALITQLGMMPQAMQAQAQQAHQQQEQRPRHERHSGKKIDVRHIKVPSFDGSASKFDDWSFAFRRTIRSANRNAYDLLAVVENMTIIDEQDLDLDMDGEWDQGDIDAYSAELYDILCQACQGEALTCLRSVKDMKGLEAWSKIYKKFNPKTMARAIRLVGAVTNPPRVKDIKDAEAELDKWEEQVKVLKKDFGETFSDTVRVGIITTMMPQSV